MTPGEVLRGVAGAHRRDLVALAGWSLVQALPTLISGQLLARALDTGFLAGHPGAGVAWLVLLGAISVVGGFATQRSVPPTAAVADALRDHLVRAVVTGELTRAVATNSPQDTGAVTRITRQTEQARQLAASLLLVVRGVVFSVGAALVGLLTLAPLLALLAVPSVCVIGVLLWPLTRLMRIRYRASLLADERVAELATRQLSAARDILASGAVHTAANRLEGRLREQACATMAMARAGTARVGVVAVAARLPVLLLIVLAPWLVTHAGVTAGQLLGAASYLVQGLGPALRMLVHSIANVVLQLRVVLTRLTERATVTTPAHRPGVVPSGFDVEFDQVGFRYGAAAAPVLDNTSFTLRHGAHVTLVGPSGVGKSTLVNLLAGVERPAEGMVRIGGHDLAEIDPGWLRANVALVPQEAYVFGATLRENLAYLRPEVTDAELDEACAELGLTGVVSRLGGYDAALERPDLLSEGERQLVTLVRVYLSAAEIVLLDEATCHLDPDGERRVEAAFARRHGTLFVIAHRISSARRAPRLFTLENGILHDGTHESLRHTSPLYAELVAGWSADPVSAPR